MRFVTADDLTTVALRASSLLIQENVVSAVTVGGSLSRGDTDEMSDVDLFVWCEPGAISAIWERRRAIADQIGSVDVIVDIPDLVPWSFIVFLTDSVRLHLTVVEDTGHLLPPDQIVLHDKVASRDATSHYRPDSGAHDPYSWERFYFWLNRAVVGVHRADPWQVLDADIQLITIAASELALARGKEFYGLRRLATFLERDEEERWAEWIQLGTESALGGRTLDIVDLYLTTMASVPSGQRRLPDRAVELIDGARSALVRIRQARSEK